MWFRSRASPGTFKFSSYFRCIPLVFNKYRPSIESPLGRHFYKTAASRGLFYENSVFQAGIRTRRSRFDQRSEAKLARRASARDGASNPLEAFEGTHALSLTHIEVGFTNPLSGTLNHYAQISETIRGNLIAKIIFRHPLLHKLGFATHSMADDFRRKTISVIRGFCLIHTISFAE
jgi:hypothetical protein